MHQRKYRGVAGGRAGRCGPGDRRRQAHRSWRAARRWPAGAKGHGARVAQAPAAFGDPGGSLGRATALQRLVRRGSVLPAWRSGESACAALDAWSDGLDKRHGDLLSKAFSLFGRVGAALAIDHCPAERICHVPEFGARLLLKVPCNAALPLPHLRRRAAAARALPRHAHLSRTCLCKPRPPAHGRSHRAVGATRRDHPVPRPLGRHERGHRHHTYGRRDGQHATAAAAAMAKGRPARGSGQGAL